MEAQTNIEDWSVIVMVGLDESQDPPAAIQRKVGGFLTRQEARSAAEKECDRLGGHGYWIQNPTNTGHKAGAFTE